MDNETPNFYDLSVELSLARTLLEMSVDYMDIIAKQESDKSKVYEFNRLQGHINNISTMLRDKLISVSEGMKSIENVELKRGVELKEKG